MPTHKAKKNVSGKNTASKKKDTVNLYDKYMKKNNRGMYMYKIMEGRLRDIDSKTYNELKKCSKENCKDEFDTSITSINKIFQLQTDEVKKITNKINKKHSKKLKMLDDPKINDKEKSKIIKQFFTELRKSTKPIMKKYKKKTKDITKSLKKCQTTHCKSELVPYKKLLDKHKKKTKKELNAFIKIFKKKKSKKKSKKSSK